MNQPTTSAVKEKISEGNEIGHGEVQGMGREVQLRFVFCPGRVNFHRKKTTEVRHLVVRNDRITDLLVHVEPIESQLITIFTNWPIFLKINRMRNERREEKSNERRGVKKWKEEEEDWTLEGRSKSTKRRCEEERTTIERRDENEISLQP